ncbi:MAG: hypothetical protein AAF152_17460 [Cyanobacteria bacterium P01_A01_bin.114]
MAALLISKWSLNNGLGTVQLPVQNIADSKYRLFEIHFLNQEIITVRFAISKKLFLTLLTIGLIAGAGSAAEAYTQLPQVSNNGFEYLAQFPPFLERSDLDDDDLEDIREEIGDRRDDRREDRRDDIEDDLEDCFDDDDRRECLDDVREDFDDRPGRSERRGRQFRSNRRVPFGR